MLFNSNVMILAVPTTAPSPTDANPRFIYHIAAYTSGSKIDANAIHSYGANTAGLDFSGGLSGMPIWPNRPT